MLKISSLPASGEFYCQLMILANSLDPDRACLDPSCLTLMLFLKEYFEKSNVEKNICRHQKCMKIYPACKELQH